MIVVPNDASGPSTSLQPAIDAAPVGVQAPTLILVRAGVYDEKVVVHKPNVRIVGADAEKTILTHSDHAHMTFPDGAQQGTFCTYTLLVCADDVEIENMTIRNDAGPGKAVGQALAVYAAGDRGVFRACRLIAHQDTLYCGPVSEKTARVAAPYNPGRIDSPGDCADLGKRVYLKTADPRDVDFIFGPYRCWFEGCTLFCNDRAMETNGYYTAANTPWEAPYGFIFHRCHLTGAAADGTVYLGRPWRSGAHTVFLSCRMDACVPPAGWLDWGDKRHPFAMANTAAPVRRAARQRHRQAARFRRRGGALSVRDRAGRSDGWDPRRRVPAVFVSGDSTASPYGPEVYPPTGWGSALPAFLDGGVYVYNEAASGRSTKSFMDERRLENIAACLRPGDMLLIQFGHNDEKIADPARGTDPDTTFSENLAVFIQTARSAGAQPVLLTSLARRHFDENGRLKMTHGAYPDAMRKLAKALEVPLLDVEQVSYGLVAQLGPEKSKTLYNYIPKGHRNYPDGNTDDTHLCFDGAMAVAQIVARLMVAHRLPLSEHVVSLK
jgi:pectinesterase